MKLMDICCNIPHSWMEDAECRVPKKQSAKRNREILNPYTIGMRRLTAMDGFPEKHFSQSEIEEIGRASINRTRIIVGKRKGKWTFVDANPQTYREFRGHGYLIRGRKVIPLFQRVIGTFEENMSRYEAMDTSCPIDKMKEGSIFQSLKGERSRKKKSSGGTFTPNRPLTQMSMSRASIEGNRISRWGITIQRV